MPMTDDRRERAARALCRKVDYSEDTMFDGRPAWEWYLDRADAVLDAALTPEEMQQLEDGQNGDPTAD